MGREREGRKEGRKERTNEHHLVASGTFPNRESILQPRYEYVPCLGIEHATFSTGCCYNQLNHPARSITYYFMSVPFLLPLL